MTQSAVSTSTTRHIFGIGWRRISKVGEGGGGGYLSEAAEGAMTDASPEEQLSSERLINIGVCRRQIGLFRGRGWRALTLSYARLDRGGRHTLAVVEAKS